MIPGATPEVVRAASAAHATVLRHRTSTRSRPPTHVIDEPEEVDRRVMRESPTDLELPDGIVQRHRISPVRAVGPTPRRRWVSHASSVCASTTRVKTAFFRDQTFSPPPTTASWVCMR